MRRFRSLSTVVTRGFGGGGSQNHVSVNMYIYIYMYTCMLVRIKYCDFLWCAHDSSLVEAIVSLVDGQLCILIRR